MIENNVIAGTCLNRGCIPTKLLIHGAELLQELKHGKKFGIMGNFTPDFEQAMEHQRSVITEAQSKAEKNLRSFKKITIIKGTASFIDKNTIKVNNKDYQGRYIIIATGGEPQIPKVKGEDQVTLLDSTSALQLTKKPETVVLVGGGYISIEFAFFFAMYGCKTILVYRGERILKNEDPEITEVLQKNLEKIGIQFFLETEVLEVGKKGARKYIKIKTKKRTEDLICDEIMFNTGRKPNTEMLHLEKIGIKTDKGNIPTNVYLQTNISHIYAIGDVNGKELFAHTGKREAKVAIQNIFGKKKIKMDYHAAPYAVFTYPQIGGVGIDEQTAKARKIPYEVERAYFSQNGKAKILYEPEGFVKLVFSKKGKLLGARIIGAQAAELIHEFILLMNVPGNQREIIHETIHIHPTLSEVSEHLG